MTIICNDHCVQLNCCITLVYLVKNCAVPEELYMHEDFFSQLFFLSQLFIGGLS